MIDFIIGSIFIILGLVILITESRFDPFSTTPFSKYTFSKFCYEFKEYGDICLITGLVIIIMLFI